MRARRRFRLLLFVGMPFFGVLMVATWVVVSPKESPLEFSVVKSTLVQRPPSIDPIPAAIPPYELIEYEIKNTSSKKLYYIGGSIQAHGSSKHVFGSDLLDELSPGETKRSEMRVYLHVRNSKEWRKVPLAFCYQWWPAQGTWRDRFQMRCNELRGKLPQRLQALAPEFSQWHQSKMENITIPPVSGEDIPRPRRRVF